MALTPFSRTDMDLFASISTVKPGLPARTGDAASDGETGDETAVFGVFLDLALSIPSPDAVIVAGPEGETLQHEASDEATETDGNAAMPGGNILPGILPLDLPTMLPVNEEPAEAGADSDRSLRTPIGIPSLDRAVIATPNGAEPDLSLPTVQQTPIQVSLPAITTNNLGGPAQTMAKITALPEAIATVPTVPALQVGNIPETSQPVSTATVAAAIASGSAGNITLPVMARLAERLRDTQSQPRVIPQEMTDSVANRESAATAPVEAAVARPVAPVASPVSGSGKSVSAPVAPRPDAGSDQPAGLPDLTPTSPEPEADNPAPRAAGPAPIEQADAAAAPVMPDSPLAPIAETRAAATAQPLSAVSVRAPDAAPQDFGDIVERLARARETEQPDLVRTTVSTRDFGPVAMQMRTVENRLHVAMINADPGFAPAVQAASATAASGQQSSPDSSSQQQSQSQQGQQATLSSGSGQSAPDSQNRQQQSERAGQQAQSRNTSATAAEAAEPHGDETGTIYA
ncbi:MAG: hypothetical protein KDE32_13690 [Novosphingobium sp.]|nr:hypothetical protein [Novosphingobium sp.]